MSDFEFDSLFSIAGVENNKDVFINLLYYFFSLNDNELLKEFLIHELFIYEDIELFGKIKSFDKNKDTKCLIERTDLLVVTESHIIVFANNIKSEIKGVISDNEYTKDFINSKLKQFNKDEYVIVSIVQENKEDNYIEEDNGYTTVFQCSSLYNFFMRYDPKNINESYYSEFKKLVKYMSLDDSYKARIKNKHDAEYILIK